VDIVNPTETAQPKHAHPTTDTTHRNTPQHTATHRNTPQHTATHRNTPSSSRTRRRPSRKSRKSADRGGTTSVLTKLDRVKHQAKKSLKTIQSNPFEFGVMALAAILAGQQLGAHTCQPHCNATQKKKNKSNI
jgi:hypothetical protein